MKYLSTFVVISFEF